MIVVHANDPTTRVLRLLYEQREDVKMCITEKSTNGAVRRALKADDAIMMLGHGNRYGLFSKPNRRGVIERRMVDHRHVMFLRGKTCIGIWCFANKFADKYKLHGLFSGMIISELQEAIENKIPATKEEIDAEMEKFTLRLKYCIENYPLDEVPQRMLELDDTKSELTRFNYGNLVYYT